MACRGEAFGRYLGLDEALRAAPRDRFGALKGQDKTRALSRWSSFPLPPSASARTSERPCEVRRRKTYRAGTLVSEFQPTAVRKNRRVFGPAVCGVCCMAHLSEDSPPSCACMRAFWYSHPAAVTSYSRSPSWPVTPHNARSSASSGCPAGLPSGKTHMGGTGGPLSRLPRQASLIPAQPPAYSSCLRNPSKNRRRTAQLSPADPQSQGENKVVIV